MRCLVIHANGTTLRLHTNIGEDCIGHIKGSFRLRNIETTNPAVVGDWVEVDDSIDHWVTKIYPRRNYIIRRSTNLSKQAHILAANIDRAFLVITFQHPATSLVFVDRFLATAEAYNIHTTLLFNKTDILTENEMQQQNQIIHLYQSLGYNSFALSFLKLKENNEPYNSILQLLQGKITLLAGNSGVGKSTLINALPGNNITKVSDLSLSHDTGIHTTTFSQMYALPFPNTWIIDTPGVKGFGMVEMSKNEIDHYFRDIFTLSKHCKYNNCLHVDESDCAVKNAVKSNLLPISRYRSYLSLLQECNQKKYRQDSRKS